ncbi:MAG: prepilin-type N-terminal cleavage/methylation domain-containing protein [Candidatus Omnitrophica bacterium]|nr:prepilin-type N-terminal cleavage/methylation domain-containing protein [Candidatus Omnitrophota bacterium]
MRMRERGMTLVEVLIASVITAVSVAGTATAFVAAARMTRAQSNPGTAEAAMYARETAERFRDRVACQGPWFDPATCQPTGLPGGWVRHDLPSSAGTESIINSGARRCYRVTPRDCGDLGVVSDCLAIEVRVCWNGDFTNCPC